MSKAGQELAALKLSNSLDKYSYLCTKKCRMYVESVIGVPTVDTDSIINNVLSIILDYSAKSAPLMDKYLYETTGEHSEFVQIGWSRLYEVLNEFNTAKSHSDFMQIADKTGAAMVDHCTRQLFSTQDKIINGDNSLSFRHIRILSNNACEFCRNAKDIYDNGGEWLSHRGCSCMKGLVRI